MLERIVYFVAIVCAVLTWFFAVRYPLWVDETVSYWQIAAGFSQLWARHGSMFVAYPFVLWIAKSILGTSALALRSPSILASLAAVYFFYKVAERSFGKTTARLATVFFCIHPAVIFASIDARPYALTLLSEVIAIYFMLRWMESNGTRDGALFGCFSALMIYFHLLFGIMVPAFALCLYVGRRRNMLFRPGWMAAIIPFTLMCVPLISTVVGLFRTSSTHVFLERPTVDELALAFAPDFVLALFAVAMLLAATMKRVTTPIEKMPGASALAMLLALVPLLGFFIISTLTPIHMFLSRYYLAAVPGLALCWGMMASVIGSRWLRASFCSAVVLASLLINYHPTFSAPHGYTWKFALDAAEKNTGGDHAPIIVFSDMVESNHAKVSFGADSINLPQLSYYRLSSPVTGLPRSLTPVARRELDAFITDASQRRRRFLAMGFRTSYDSIRYMVERSRGTYEAREVGVYDNVAVVEFRPK